jgi:hypothetical protein
VLLLASQQLVAGGLPFLAAADLVFRHRGCLLSQRVALGLLGASFELDLRRFGSVCRDTSGDRNETPWMHFAHVWTFRDGLIARMEMYADRSEALEAAGLRE